MIENKTSSLNVVDPNELLPDASITTQRQQWGSKKEYMLSLIGFSVGLGNLWRFPYLCNKNGGGAFLIPFLFFVLFCGLPMFFLEVTLAQFSAKGAVGLWAICPLFRGIGIAMPLVSWFISLYYNIIIAWCIYYIYRSFSKTLPWTTCDNWWNTPFCRLSYFTNNGTTANNSGQPHDIIAHSSVEEFWQYCTLRISFGIEYLGDVQWHLVVCLLLAWIIVYLCLIRGVKSVGKVVYVTAVLPYFLLLVILFRGVAMPGAVEGILYYLKPDFKKLLTAKVWTEACVQVFYSLGPSWGGVLTMASYNKFNNNCLRDSVIATLVSESTSIFSGFVIFTFLGVMAKRHGVSIADVVSSARLPLKRLVVGSILLRGPSCSLGYFPFQPVVHNWFIKGRGPGLGFVVYPEALSQLPLPQIWSFLFFLMLLMIGLDSLFVNFEVAASSIIDRFTLLQPHRMLVLGFLAFISFLFGLILCCNGGIFIFQLLDWYVAALIVFVGILECIIVAWIYGFYRMDKDLIMMIGKPVPLFFKIVISTVAPISLTISAILTLVSFGEPVYGTYTYPKYAIWLGFIWAAIPIVPIPTVMVIAIWKTKGTMKERLMQTLTPSSEWLPQLWKYHADYDHRQPPSLRRSYKSIFSYESNKHEGQ